jgi:hypothetical protein
MGRDNSKWWERISKWWTLIVLGAISLLVGLFTDNLKALGAGVILLVIGGAGEGYNQLDVSVFRGRLRLKRETVQEAMFRIAIEKGVPPSEAIVYAKAIAADFPEEGAPVKVNESGNVEAVLSDSSQIVFRRPQGKKLTEEDLAEELAESHGEDLQRQAQTRNAVMPELLQIGDPRQLNTVESSSTVTTEIEPAIPPAFGLLQGFEGKLDPAKRFLVYSTGAYSLRTYEVKPGSQVMIGRGEGNDLSLIGPRVSRTHALLKCPADGPAVINNIASTHGVYVNGVRVEGEQLHNGDTIGIGDFTLLYIGPAHA